MPSPLLSSRRQSNRHRHRKAAAAALLLSSIATFALAQADGAVNGTPAVAVMPAASIDSSTQPMRIAPANAPGGALMNNLDARMRQIHATQNPELRQRRMGEFLKALQGGMEHIGKNGSAAAQ